MTRRALPSLPALRALEAAVRLRGFSSAADELGVTHGAVSRHVRQLEQVLGVELFRRDPGRAVPTWTGEQLGAALTGPFEAMADAVEAVRRGPERRSLRLSVDPAFATLWLLPRLADFRREAGEAEISIDSSTHLADVAAGPIDVAIRYRVEANPPVPEGCLQERLFALELFPAAAPALAARLGSAPDPAVIARLPLIHEDSRDPWRRWLTRAGVAPPSDGGLMVNDAAHAEMAAEQEAGIVLADPIISVRALESGRLVPLSDRRVTIGGYWLVTPAARALAAPARGFVRWLRATLTQGADGPAT
ncbi:LysR family transcriptional regulator [Marivibrio halodurans]|uniref:LysR family transcriptional regulator n=1 Tax=Marivibrio halodurans TaxID=2039722 RepID=A0A8J7S3J9_9PROT|nr:LysR substrate-binding domain-containing protein [Marivibrio halodurans]MBP5858059.1 LysR family transcriptional regulator [Marivibrio halodurans]